MNNCIYCQLSLSYAPSLFNKGFLLPNNIKTTPSNVQLSTTSILHVTIFYLSFSKRTYKLLPVTFSGPNLKYEY